MDNCSLLAKMRLNFLPFSLSLYSLFFITLYLRLLLCNFLVLWGWWHWKLEHACMHTIATLLWTWLCSLSLTIISRCGGGRSRVGAGMTGPNGGGRFILFIKCNTFIQRLIITLQMNQQHHLVVFAMVVVVLLLARLTFNLYWTEIGQLNWYFCGCHVISLNKHLLPASFRRLVQNRSVQK